MKTALFLYIMAISSAQIVFGQNVGIGTTTPTDGKLHVDNTGTNSSTIGAFTNGLTTVSLINESDRAGIGMNMSYKTGTYKFKGNGFGGLFYHAASSGSMIYYSSTASGTAGNTVGFSPLFTIAADGNVGIGITTPTEAKLQVHEPSGNTQFIAAAGSNLPGISIFVPVSSPSIGFNTRFQSGYKFMGAGYGSFFQFSPSAGRLDYWYSSTKGVADGNLSSQHSLSVDSNGRLGIGTQLPKAPLHVTGNVVFGSSSILPATGYKLSVDGKVICEELKVQLNSAWPDYVFEDSYPLLSLDNLEKKVMAQKHLPNIPPAAQIDKQKGFEMGDMQQRLLEKVEELYRYLFEVNKENKDLKLRLAAVETKLKS